MKRLVFAGLITTLISLACDVVLLTTYVSW